MEVTSLQKPIPKLRFKAFEEAWKRKKLKHIGSFFSGGTPLTTKKLYYEGSIPFIKSGEINSDKTSQFISYEALNNSSAKMVRKGDLLYALYGATSGEVAISKLDGAINQAVLCIRTDENNFFTYNYLKKNKQRIISTYLQGGQGNLSADIIKSLIIPYPSLPEQQKIASFLSAVDQKIELVGRQLVQNQAFKKGLLQQMFV